MPAKKKNLKYEMNNRQNFIEETEENFM